MKKSKTLGIAILIIATVFGSGYVIQAVSSGVNNGARESFEIAGDFVKNSPTYLFDGYNLRLRETNRIVCVTTPCPDAWVFNFEFASTHAGYGDRTGQALAQVLTSHVAVVTVEDGSVVSAVLDEKWDMMRQELIE